MESSDLMRWPAGGEVGRAKGGETTGCDRPPGDRFFSFPALMRLRPNAGQTVATHSTGYFSRRTEWVLVESNALELADGRGRRQELPVGASGGREQTDLCVLSLVAPLDLARRIAAARRPRGFQLHKYDDEFTPFSLPLLLPLPILTQCKGRRPGRN